MNIYHYITMRWIRPTLQAKPDESEGKPSGAQRCYTEQEEPVSTENTFPGGICLSTRRHAMTRAGSRDTIFLGNPVPDPLFPLFPI